MKPHLLLTLLLLATSGWARGSREAVEGDVDKKTSSADNVNDIDIADNHNIDEDVPISATKDDLVVSSSVIRPKMRKIHIQLPKIASQYTQKRRIQGLISALKNPFSCKKHF